MIASISACVYLTIGLILYIFIAIEDAQKESPSTLGFLSDILSLHVFGAIIFFINWPIWVMFYFLLRED